MLHDIVADASVGLDAFVVVGPSATGPSAGAAWKATIGELRALSDRVLQRAVVAQAGGETEAAAGLALLGSILGGQASELEGAACAEGGARAIFSSLSIRSVNTQDASVWVKYGTA